MELTSSHATRSFSQSKTAFWAGLCVVWIFALAFMQFAFIDHWAVPSSERVNDGQHATFFSVNINPYFIFSEDFHLYSVRSKRIFERGWTGSILHPSSQKNYNYAAPIQVAMMGLAAKTGGEPLYYSALLTLVLGCAWSLFFLAAFFWSPPSISSLTVINSVLFTVLFEAVSNVSFQMTEYGQWPVHRGLRLATLGWTSPLLAALLLALTSFIYCHKRISARLIFIGVASFIIAMTDSWAFLITASSIFLVLVLLLIQEILLWMQQKRRFNKPFQLGLWLTLSLLSSVVFNQLTAAGLSRDAFTRSGFGPLWRQSPSSMLLHLSEAQNSFYSSLHLLIIISGVGWFIFKDKILRHWLLFLILIPSLSWLITIMAVSLVGMEYHHFWQFSWRRDYLLLFGLTVLVFELANSIVVKACRYFRAERLRIQLAFGFLFLLVFGVYHYWRINTFVRNVAAREFFLTEDQEELKAWLKRKESGLGRYSLATASHEINYLCAFWTTADLLLPEGFPYHGNLTTEDIEKQTARVLFFFGATPEKWMEFALDGDGWDQWIWASSRILAARYGYLYYLLHRELFLDGVSKSTPLKIDPEYRKLLESALTNSPNLKTFSGTTLFQSQNRIKNLLKMDTRNELEHLAGKKAKQAIADYMKHQPPFEEFELPDVVITDEVSQFLGTPNLSHYKREFKHGKLEGWVKRSLSARLRH